MKRRKVIATIATVLALTLSGSIALAQSKATITTTASSDEEVVVLEKQFICYNLFAGIPCNIDLELDLSVSKSVATAPLQPKVVVEQIQRRVDRIHWAVKFGLFPLLGAVGGAGVGSAVSSTKFDGRNNTVYFGGGRKGAMIGVAVGAAVGLLVHFLEKRFRCRKDWKRISLSKTC